MSHYFKHGLALVVTAALAACGGGGSDAPTSITIAGKAAGKGTAMARATIDVKCTAGSGTIPAGDDGAYTITIAQASLPCVLRAAGTTDTLHSVVAGSGNTGTYTANITPLTEMVVAKVAGASPASFYAGVSATTAVPASAVSQAVDYVKTALAGVTAITSGLARHDECSPERTG